MHAEVLTRALAGRFARSVPGQTRPQRHRTKPYPSHMRGCTLWRSQPSFIICIAMAACMRPPVDEAERLCMYMYRSEAESQSRYMSMSEHCTGDVRLSDRLRDHARPSVHTSREHVRERADRQSIGSGHTTCTLYTDPLTNEVMRSKTLTPNFALRSAIATWTERRRGGTTYMSMYESCQSIYV